MVANAGTVFASQCPRAALSSLPEVIVFYHTVKVLISKTLYISCLINGAKNR